MAIFNSYVCLVDPKYFSDYTLINRMVPLD